MNEGMKKAPIWMLPQLWALDVPVAALSWGLAYAALMQIPMMTVGPLLLLTASTWIYAMIYRTARALCGVKDEYSWYYLSHVGVIAPIVLCAVLATVWTLLYDVGEHLLSYATLPVIVMLMAEMPLLRRLGEYRHLLRGIALAFGCSIPAFYYSIGSPLSVVFCGPSFYLGILFYLFFHERNRWATGKTEGAGATVLTTIGMCLLMVAVLASSLSGSFFQQALSITVAIAAGCLQALCRLRFCLSDKVIYALSWPVMVLPPMLGILIFAPEEWGHYIIW